MLPGSSYTVDADPRSHSVFKGRIKDRVLSIEPGDFAMQGESQFYAVLRFSKVQLRLKMNADRTLSGLIGGYQPWLDYYHYRRLAQSAPVLAHSAPANGAEWTHMTILRKWTGRIRTAQQDEYVAYIAGTGLDDYAKTPGNLGFQMLLRELGNGESEVTTLSWWQSMDSIRAFAGATPELAKYYPEDERYLVHRPLHVEHHQIVASDLRVPKISFRPQT